MTTLFTSMSLNDYLIYLDDYLIYRCPLMTTLFTDVLMTTLFTSMSLNDYLIYLDVP